MTYCNWRLGKDMRVQVEFRRDRVPVVLNWFRTRNRSSYYYHARRREMRNLKISRYLRLNTKFNPFLQEGGLQTRRNRQTGSRESNRTASGETEEELSIRARLMIGAGTGKVRAGMGETRSRCIADPLLILQQRCPRLTGCERLP